MLFVYILSLLLSSFLSICKGKDVLSLIKEKDLDKIVKQVEAESEYIFRNAMESKNYLNPFLKSPESRHQVKVCPAYKPNDAQSLLEAITTNLVKKYNLKKSDINLLQNLTLNSDPIRNIIEQCTIVKEKFINCSDIVYRTFNGRCNNLERPQEGMTFSCLCRLSGMVPDYGDGVGSPRKGKFGPLPEPRFISINLHRMGTKTDADNIWTIWLMNFGQFLDHDMELTTLSSSTEGDAIQCCGEGPFNQACFPIKIPPDDPDFINRTCMNFVRDENCPSCSLGRREQMNSLTVYIDCSQIYGTSDKEAKSLRTMNGNGELNSSKTDIGELLPDSNNPDTDQCSRPGLICFSSGDPRVNQSPLLQTLHTVFMRLHNKIARELRKLNPCWDGETTYQETRKIVIAIFQHIVYNEYLPTVIGDKHMNEYRLSEVDTEYDHKIPVCLINSFAAAAFRLHPTVPDGILVIDEQGGVTKTELKDSFFNVTLVRTRKLDDIIRGGTEQYQDKFSPLMADSITKYLYRVNNSTTLDLAAINIQRGRDHGLPGYKYFVEKIHNLTINSFEDLRNSKLLEEKYVDQLEKLYEHVEDIDLFSGLFCEKPLSSNIVVGHTAAHIIAYEFHMLKYGDRFFYSHKVNTQSFTEEQKTLIQSILLSHVFCYVTNMTKIKERIFLRKEISNTIVNCEKHKEFDFSAWKY